MAKEAGFGQKVQGMKKAPFDGGLMISLQAGLLDDVYRDIGCFARKDHYV
jgi:hypothetical protein